MAMAKRVVLDSWKEISVYLGRSVMTCHRWEGELGLPIHRLDGTPRARVFAYADELDRWKAGKMHEHEGGDKRKAGAETGKKTAAVALGSGTQAGRKKKNWKWLGIAGSALILAAAAAGYFLLVPKSLLPLPDDKPSLAIVQLENASGDGSLAPWTTALPDLLITDLMQSRYVTVPGITDTYRKLREVKLDDTERFGYEDLKNIAAVTGVDHIATGSLIMTGQDIAVKILVHDVKTNEVAPPIEATFRKEEDVFAVADGLTRKIKSALGLDSRHISRDIDRKAAEISTSSPQAFKDFSQGYRLAGIAKNPDCIILLQKAVATDPKFALAYKCLSRACQNNLRQEDENTYIRKAVDLADRLSERERGQLLVLFCEAYERDPARRKKYLERLVHHYPDDWFGGDRLLTELLALEEWDKALPVAEQAWRANRADWSLCGKLIQCYENLSRTEAADSLLNGFVKENPKHPFLDSILTFRVWYEVRRGRFDEALETAEALVSRYQDHPSYMITKGNVHFYRDEFEEAEREFEKALAQNEASIRIEALMLSRDLNLLQGKVEAAVARLEECLEELAKIDNAAGKKSMPEPVLLGRKNALRLELAYLHRIAKRLPEALETVEAALRDIEKRAEKDAPPPPLELLHMKALVLLDMGKAEEFERLVEKIKKQIEEGERPKLMRVYYHLIGRRELKQKKVEEAVEYFLKAVDLLSIPGAVVGSAGPDPRYFYSLAEAYLLDEGGRMAQRALPLFEKVAQPLVNRLHSGDLYARSFYQIAKINEYGFLDRRSTIEEKMIFRVKAIESYRKFLSLWKDADPILGEVADAKQRLAKLEAE